MQFETVIGLEVHTQLATKTKIFSGASCTYGAEANTQACAVDLGLPGVLPVFNEKALELAVKFGLSIHAKIAHRSIFARKNYFYPDLPKGYQISQFEFPIVGKGYLDIQLKDNTKKRIGITRAHLEEDAGKSLHEGLQGVSGIDLNRTGTPLLEIVSEPDMSSAEEAVTYLKALHSLVRYLQISDGNMQEGSFRCDVNISLKEKSSDKLGTRAEIKNLNSFRFVQRAIECEIERQADILSSGGKVIQETRLYDSVKDETRSLRSKENAHDYRYFPDPDLLPVEIDDQYIEKIKNNLPELPWEKCERFEKTFGLSHYDAHLLSVDRDTADYFEDVLSHAPNTQPKIIANWIIGDLNALLNKNNLAIQNSLVKPEQFAQLLERITDNTINNSTAKKVFECMWDAGDDADTVIAAQGLKQITDTSEIEKIVDDVIAQSPEQLAQYRAGKDKLLGYFVGQVMKAMKGKANPAQVNELLKKKL